VILDLLVFSEGPLPNAKGPKLNPFPHNGGHIEFLRLLGTGEHGYVFEVIIESQRCALKVVRSF
jgi:Kinetochore Sim4 complex subunit FTA2